MGGPSICLMNIHTDMKRISLSLSITLSMRPTRALTGAEIRAFIAGLDPSYALFLEGPGNEPDRQIGDSETVTLEKDKGPKRFYTVPPATFGLL
jgi:hypothetical protein